MKSLNSVLACVAALAGLASTPGSAQTAETAPLPGLLTAGGVLDRPDPDLIFAIGAGVGLSPAYFGTDDLEFGATGVFRFDYIRFPNGFTFGSGRSVGFEEGFGLQGSVRYIGARESDDYPELTGLDDIDWTLELGLGVGYEKPTYRFFADARYGFFGHESFVGQLGADMIARPIEGLTVTLGPRVNLGDDKFAETYFGVSEQNAITSNYSAYSASGGIVSAGLEMMVLYQFDERWGVQGTFGWERLLNDAADSPITQNGDANQYGVKVALVRRISLDF